jgi:probable rRNA maturation factor
MLKLTVKNLQKKIPVRAQRIKKVISKVLSSQRAEMLGGRITVVFLSDSKIRGLNRRFLGKDSPTDVLAFSYGPGKKELSADIAVSADTAWRNAKIFGNSLHKELDLYVVHGLLHLLGYGDRTKRQRRAMQRLEKKYVP